MTLKEEITNANREELIVIQRDYIEEIMYGELHRTIQLAWNRIYAIENMQSSLFS